MTEGGPGLSTEILALRISRTATEFRELGVAAAMSNYLLMLLLILTRADVRLHQAARGARRRACAWPPRGTSDMADRTYDRQNPAFYALLVVLIFMSVGPIVLMLVNSFKLDVDITSGTSGLLFLPTIQNYETALCDILPYELDHLRFLFAQVRRRLRQLADHRAGLDRADPGDRLHGGLCAGAVPLHGPRHRLADHADGAHGAARGAAGAGVRAVEQRVLHRQRPATSAR